MRDVTCNCESTTVGKHLLGCPIHEELRAVLDAHGETMRKLRETEEELRVTRMMVDEIDRVVSLYKTATRTPG